MYSNKTYHLDTSHSSLRCVNSSSVSTTATVPVCCSPPASTSCSRLSLRALSAFCFSPITRMSITTISEETHRHSKSANRITSSTNTSSSSYSSTPPIRASSSSTYQHQYLSLKLDPSIRKRPVRYHRGILLYQSG